MNLKSGTAHTLEIACVYSTAAEEEIVAPSEVKRLVLCSGKVYYDLQRARKLNNIKDVALVRVEQISPFPFDLVKDQMDSMPNAELVWCQEEPKNQGCWQYVRPRIETASKGLEGNDAVRAAQYCGRVTAASTATGFKYASPHSHIPFVHKVHTRDCTHNGRLLTTGTRISLSFIISCVMRLSERKSKLRRSTAASRCGSFE